MKKVIVSLFSVCLSLSANAQQKPTTTTAAKPATTPKPAVKMATRIDSVSYLVGQNIGASIIKDFKEANIEVLIAAIRDVYKGNPPAINDPSNQVLNSYFQEKNNKKMEEEYKKTKQDGEKFLAENKKRDGVKVTASGLQYEVISMGTGEKPSAGSRVKVHYHGTTPDGRVFDSSVERGNPITFALNQVIKGWTEGLQLMPVGSKFKFYIPQELAYGANPQPGSVIEPYMPLVFEVELIEIEK
ncbi:MAG: hypothetical protein RL264_820 [Bacteroidota bacterium]|jgi:FKBP-type peptidyl-prolyl cis-trans isomerase FklB